MPQWIAREYLARRGGAKFTTDQVVEAPCPLLGYALRSLMVEGQNIPPFFLRVEKQPEVGEDAYNRGALMLQEFFERQLNKYLEADLNPLGRRLIECCLDEGSVRDYESLIESEPMFGDE